MSGVLQFVWHYIDAVEMVSLFRSTCTLLTQTHHYLGAYGNQPTYNHLPP